MWAAFIFIASTNTFSSEHTQTVVIGVLHTLLPYAGAATLETLHELVRKSAHVGEYFVFGALLYRAIRTPAEGWRWSWAFLALLIAALYASSDEMHQIIVPSRGASVWDALLDTSGATLAQMTVWLLHRREGPAGNTRF